MSIVTQTPDDPAIMVNLEVDQVDLAIDMTVKKSLISADGLSSTFSLDAGL